MQKQRRGMAPVWKCDTTTRGEHLTFEHGRWKCLKVGGASSGRGHGERVEREPITGVWGQSPWWCQGGEAPLKLKVFWFLNVPRSGKTYHVVSF